MSFFMRLCTFLVGSVNRNVRTLIRPSPALGPESNILLDTDVSDKVPYLNVPFLFFRHGDGVRVPAGTGHLDLARHSHPPHPRPSPRLPCPQPPWRQETAARTARASRGPPHPHLSAAGRPGAVVLTEGGTAPAPTPHPGPVVPGLQWQ